jgi:hypothetical protein
LSFLSRSFAEFTTDFTDFTDKEARDWSGRRRKRQVAGVSTNEAGPRY